MRSIIIDCDPGLDDAVAIFLAAGTPSLDIRAITTVSGNQTVEKVTQNALGLAALAGLSHIPIAAGCDRPLVRPAVHADAIHGETGLGAVVLPHHDLTVDPRHGVDVIIEEIMAAEPGEITIAAIGPLTNLAVALQKEPAIVERVREVVVMGGSLGKGNYTPAAEFNFYADPEAAKVVLEAGWPVVMIGLTLTHQALIVPDVVSRLLGAGSELTDTLDQLFISYNEACAMFEEEAAAMHDACAIAYCIDPSVMDCEQMPLSVIIDDGAELGRSIVVEEAGAATAGTAGAATASAPTAATAQTPHPHTTSAAITLHAEEFWTMLEKALVALPL